MAEVEVLLPKMGESVAEATITSWLKQVGDTVEAEESLVEIATDKVDSEVPSPQDGVITKILFDVDDVVQVGQPICIISTEGGAEAPAPAPAAQPVAAPASNGAAAAEAVPHVPVADAAPAPVAVASNGDRFYSPLVRNIAQTEGIGQAELDAVPGTGKDGRVTKKDILSYVENRGSAPATQPAATATAAPPAPAPTPAPTANGTPAPAAKPAPAAAAPAEQKDYGANTEIIEMDRMRKLIADHMVMSKHTSPHVTSFVEADVTAMVNWRNKVKKPFLDREGEKITFTPLFVEAVVKALKDYPMVNVSVDGNKIIRKKDLNIGMAAALPSGNLIVPVIKNADRYNLVGLTKAVNDLAGRARNNKLQPDEISGGTFTLTNVGTFGNVMGTPIINQPQVAIMATGAIRKKPAVIETPQGDFIGIRHMMFLSLSYDHRVVDGMLGGSFLRRVADYLEDFDENRDF